jgi:signal transduction histidine kinase
MTQLVQSLNDIKKVQKSKESFFTNISHEMKTPLNAILGFSSVLKSIVKNNAKALSIVQTLHESGSQLHELIDTILDLGKLQNNKLNLEKSTFNPRELILNCATKYQEKASEQKQSFTLSFDDNVPVLLLGDGPRIVQLLKIFFDNAVKFTPDKGSIKVEVGYQDEKLHCSITDSGIGIKKEDQKKIFNYEQIDSDFTRSHEGAGVELTLASLLVTLMKGEIKLKSIPQKGSCFELILPLEEHND